MNFKVNRNITSGLVYNREANSGITFDRNKTCTMMVKDLDSFSEIYSRPIKEYRNIKLKDLKNKLLSYLSKH